ncbi:MAG: hypothetical protein ACREQY_19425, partial [Candidatus Binatia bacterium]
MRTTSTISRFDRRTSRGSAAALRLVARASIVAAVVAAAWLEPAHASGLPRIEFTFDDGPDGSGPAQGLAELINIDGRNDATVTMRGSTHRSNLDQGRYGRAGKFYGNGAGNDVLIENPPSMGSEFGFAVWLKPETGSGQIFSHENNWRIYLSNGTVRMRIFTIFGPDDRSLNVQVPVDAQWHHLLIHWHPDADPPDSWMAAEVDFTTTGVQPFLPLPTGQNGEIHMGKDYAGFMDEVFFYTNAPGSGNAFDRNPTWCPGGHACVEEVITVTPQDHYDNPYPYQAPVRFKSVYDPTKCTPATPCTMVVDVSGGFACADDYDSPSHVEGMADNYLFVVTVDPFCLADGYGAPVDEISQVRAVKDYMFNQSALRDRIIPGTYTASGCSHGANLVLAWAAEETDYPARTFAR